MFDFLTQKFSSLFSSLSSKKQLDEDTVRDALEKIDEILLSADIPYQVVEAFRESVAKEAIGLKRINNLKPSEQLLKLVYDKMVLFLAQKESAQFDVVVPARIMVMGLQGAGKTTTLAKLAAYLKKAPSKHKQAKKIVVASVDYQRPSAIEQLRIMAAKAQVDFYQANADDPLKAVEEIKAHVQKQRYDILLLDTAGRLHINTAMLDQLKRIDASICPTQKLLVLDAMTGQESLNIADAFNQGVGFNGAILSKCDSDARGGAAFSFRYLLKKPIFFIATGEKIEDLALFHPERAVSRMLGMGDIPSFLERVNERIKEDEQRSMNSSWQQGQLTLEDFANQMDMINRLGSLSSIMKYMPGMAGLQLPAGALEDGQAQMKLFRVIIQSMTPKERLNASILNNSRKKRIARGAGVNIADIENLLSRFVNMQQYAKLIKKSGGFRNFFK